MKKNIRLLFYLPNLKSYPDRAYLVQEISMYVEKVILVVSKIDASPSEIQLNDLDIREVPRTKKIIGDTFFCASKFAQKLIEEEDINVVHDTFGHLLFTFLKKWKYKHVRFITSFYILAKWDYVNFLKPRYGFKGVMKYPDLRLWYSRLFFQKAMAFLADKVVVQAAGLKERLIESYSFTQDKIHVLPNNIESRLFEQKYPEMELGFKKIHVLYVGGFCIGKGALTIIGLVKEAKKRNIALKMSCVGGIAEVDKEFLTELMKKENVIDDIHFLIRTDRKGLNKLYRQNHYLIHVSQLDGSPRVVLEALSQGLCVIGSNHPGIRSIDPHHQFIVQVEENDVDSILKEFQSVTHDQSKWKKKSLKGQKHVCDNHSSSAIAKQYVNFYDEII